MTSSGPWMAIQGLSPQVAKGSPLETTAWQGSWIWGKWTGKPQLMQIDWGRSVQHIVRVVECERRKGKEGGQKFAEVR